MTSTCPSCGAAATGKYCGSCGTPLAGASCPACGASLTPGARFCHRCGTPAGARQAAATARDPGNVLPWAVAAIALLALVALVAGQRFGRTSDGRVAQGQAAQDMPAGAQRAPDISALTPEDRAERLYDRVMGAAERGRVDTVQFFMPMAIQAYQAIGTLNVDQRYDLGRLAEVGGNAAIASAQADSILRDQPQHLLGLLLASRAARLRGDEAAANRYLQQLVRAEKVERAKQLPEYLLHQNDIDIALRERSGATRTP